MADGDVAQQFSLRYRALLRRQRYTMCLTGICGEDDKAPSFNMIPSDLLKNLKYHQWFQDCVGAIDEMHIPGVVPTKKAVLYRSGRKNEWTHNIIAICSFHMRLTWIWLGLEGSIHDFSGINGGYSKIEYQLLSPTTRTTRVGLGPEI